MPMDRALAMVRAKGKAWAIEPCEERAFMWYVVPRFVLLRGGQR
jgi:hypothetical protein